MKCSISGENAKLFAKAIQVLAKVGADLYMEATSFGLQLRTINSNASVVWIIKFYKSFFQRFTIQTEKYCNVSLKASLAIFRNMSQVEYCEIHLIPEEARCRIQFKCRLDTMKNAFIGIVEKENIATTLSSNGSLNVIIAPHHVFSEISNSFNTLEQEVTLKVQTGLLIAKNYMEGIKVNDNFMRSRLKLSSSEFDTYQIGRETTITFCLKEFRNFLSFAEILNADVIFKFGESGRPMFLKLQKCNELNCILIMTTLSPEDLTFHEELCRNESLVCSNISKNLRITTNQSKQQVELDEGNEKQISAKTSVSNHFCISGYERSHLFLYNSTAHNVKPKDEQIIKLSVAEQYGVDDSSYACKEQRLRTIFSRCFQSTFISNDTRDLTENKMTPNKDG